MTPETPRLRPEELDALDHAVRSFLKGGAPGTTPPLDLVGAGELTCVVGWQGYACKRLPPVASHDRAQRYGALVLEYVDALRTVGIRVVETDFQVAGSGGTYAGYAIQPRLPGASLLPGVMRALGDADCLAVVERILDHVDAAVAGGVGIDPQISNWAMIGGDLVFLDITTPMLRDADGRDRLDTEMFLAALPWLIRGVVRRFLVADLLEKNFNKRLILLDLVGNVKNYGLTHLTEPMLGAINHRLDEPLTLREVERYRREDTATWWVLRRAFVVEHLWRRYVLRRPALHLVPASFKGPARDPA